MFCSEVMVEASFMFLNYKGVQTGDEQVQGSSQCRLRLRGAEENAKAQRPSTQGCSHSLGSDPKR